MYIVVFSCTQLNFNRFIWNMHLLADSANLKETLYCRRKAVSAWISCKDSEEFNKLISADGASTNQWATHQSFLMCDLNFSCARASVCEYFCMCMSVCLCTCCSTWHELHGSIMHRITICLCSGYFSTVETLQGARTYHDLKGSLTGDFDSQTTNEGVTELKDKLTNMLEGIKDIIKGVKEASKHHKQWTSASKKAFEEERKRKEKQLGTSLTVLVDVAAWPIKLLLICCAHSVVKFWNVVQPSLLLALWKGHIFPRKEKKAKRASEKASSPNKAWRSGQLISFFSITRFPFPVRIYTSYIYI